MNFHSFYKNIVFYGLFKLPVLLSIIFMPQILLAAESCEDPVRLSFSAVPDANVQLDLQKFQPLLKRIEKATKKPVDTVRANSYGMVIEGLLSGAVDIALLGPASYISARKADPGIEPIATMSKKAGAFQGEGLTYHSLLITSSKGDKLTLAALRGANLGMVDPNSTSGSVIPRHYFSRQNGLMLEAYFKRIIYTGNHYKSALAVLNGQVDAAFVASYHLSDFVRSGKAKADDYTVLWRSPPIPTDPIVLRSNLCNQLTKTIRAVILDANAATNLDVLNAFEATRFVPVNDRDYQSVRSVFE